jgi:hypothetical protein
MPNPFVSSGMHTEKPRFIESGETQLFLGAKKRLYKRLRRLVGWLVGWYVPTMQLHGKLVTSRLLWEEEKEEETDYVAIPSLWAA